ncbi:MAG: ABC transporter permease [Candidatus Omnitrophica bacterium]|nr:ABC transporter permease [Candidatus Omnitrophota bacterium]
MMTLKIALRNIFRHKARSVITLSTIVFGCVALIFIGGYFEDIFTQLRESYIRSQVGHIQIFKKGFNENGKADPYLYFLEDDQQIKAEIQAFPEVKSIAARLNFSGLISTGETTIVFLGQGLEPQYEQTVPQQETRDLRAFKKTSKSGSPVISFGQGLVEEDQRQVILGQGLAQTMGAQIGSTITLLTNTVYGSTNAMDMNVKGVFYTSAKDYDEMFLRLPLKTAQKLLNTSSVGSWVVWLNKTEDTDKVYNSLRAMIKQKNLNLELRRWEDLADFYNKTVAMFNKFYLIMRIVTGIIVVLGIFNTLNMAVMERISEIGTLMALGVRRSGVMKLFLLEGLVLGTVGGLLGVVAGMIVVSLVSSVGITMPPPPGASISWLSTPKIIPSVVTSTFVLSVVVGGFSALFPAYKASRLQITTALRYR